jgi:DNA-binding NarL/FixJ family response regulator
VPTLAPFTVLLADPHARLRAAIVALLEHEDGIRVSDSAGTIGDAAAAMRRRRPDVLVADLSMTSMAGRLLAAWGPVDAAVPVVVTGFEVPATMEPALLARGAAAYVSKDRLTEHLPEVLRRVAAPSASPALFVPGRVN